MKTLGIHHISATVGHAQENMDFYASVLGLRFIKKTVNFDDRKMYHLYFGNHEAELGTILTFFPYIDAKSGLIGEGQTTTIILSIPKGSMSYWEKRFDQFGVFHFKTTRFNDKFLTIRDPHGIQLEFVESDIELENRYEFNGVTKEYAIKGIYGVVMQSLDYTNTFSFLENDLGFTNEGKDGYYQRFTTQSTFGHTVDVKFMKTNKGSLGVGTIHHIAFNVKEEELITFKEKLSKYHPTEIKNRKYFKSIYFREPGGAIIELATNSPGFTADEPLEDLGTNFRLPSHYESYRNEIENDLMPVFVQKLDTLKNYPYTDKKTYDSYINHQNLLKRVNEFAKISRERELTSEEVQERNEVRKAYVKSVTNGLRNMIEKIDFVDENDNREKAFKIKGDN